MVAEGKAEGSGTTIKSTSLRQVIPMTVKDLNGWNVIKRPCAATHTLLRAWKRKQPGNFLLPRFMKTLDQTLLLTPPTLLSRLRKVRPVRTASHEAREVKETLLQERGRYVPQKAEFQMKPSGSSLVRKEFTPSVAKYPTIQFSCIQYSSQCLFLRHGATDEPFQLAMRLIFTKMVLLVS